MQKNLLITAIDTNIGKTYLVEQICQKIPNIKVIKPIISGFNFDDINNDIYKIAKSLNIEYNLKNIDIISPWRFKLASSPHIASIKDINFEDLIQFCKKNITLAKKSQKHLLIESAGGIMSPINSDKTFKDLALNLDIEIILITSNFLGSLSQTLCAIEVIKKYHLKIHKIIVNNIKINQNSYLSDDQFIEYVNDYCNLDLIKIDNFLKNPLDL